MGQIDQPALTATETMAWVDLTHQRWRVLIAAHLEVLAIPCDIMGVSTAGELLQHIVAVELRYAERLAGLLATDYAAIPYHSAEAIYATHQAAFALLQNQLDSTVDWSERIEFVTRSRGTMSSSRKTILFHALLHSVRHYAQLATLVRRHGVTPGWLMDDLAMDMEPA